MEIYDVVILGGGPGGYVAAIRAAQLGRKVALVEKEQLGGTCLNTGCVPTKTLVRNAEIIRAAQNSGYRGIHVQGISVDIKETIEMKDMVVQQLRQGVENLLRANGVKVFKGLGRIADDSTVEIKGNPDVIKIRFRDLIIATGSKPANIKIKGAAEHAVTSEEMLNMKELPRSAVIIGGGVIGCEFAHILSALGSKVTIIEAMPRILSDADEELAAALAQYMNSAGIKIKTKAVVQEIREADGKKAVIITQGEKEEAVTAEQVMISIGRKPNLEGLESLGLEMNGPYIKINEAAKTNREHIYAIGDVTGIRPLAHAASAMGRVAAEQISGKDVKFHEALVPSCVFTWPELASVGLTEEKAREKHGEIKVGRFPLAASGKALAMGETEGLFKVISDGETGKLLGVHLLGANAAEIIGEAAAFMKMDASVNDMLGTIHAHPTISEAVQEAALDAAGICVHMPPSR